MSTMDFISRVRLTAATKREHDLLAFKVDAMCIIGASDGTLSKMSQLFPVLCGTNPDHTARALGYPNFEKFLESEYMRDAVERKFEEDGKKVFSLYPDRRIDRLLLITEKSAESELHGPVKNHRADEMTMAKETNEENAKRFRYKLCKLVRDLGGHSNLVPLQTVQDAYFRRYNEPLDKRCWFEHFETRSAQRALHFYFINELSCTIVEETGVIEMMLKYPFEDIKKNIIKEIKSYHGSDTTEIENEPLEPQPIEQVNLHVLTEPERRAVQYFKPNIRVQSASSEEPGRKSPAVRLGLGERAMMASVAKTVAARRNA
ncbi:hypothetical protein QR680_018111 [Steinernema hermaphroditum]|uniref:Uncharacterized protein n=1 Tax=Steinernema hermaphroditum TaxID=289476 RepID=A0AA39LQK5_9BILA|nr:hypothetical protein QR680_018111 [Steinernema hermaphroditum]